MGKPIKIAQYTLEGEFIRTFESAKKAASFLGKSKKSDCNITRACKLIQTFAFGYRWLYAEDMPRAKELFEQRPAYAYFQPHKLSSEPSSHTFQEILEAAAGCRTKSEFRRKNKRLYRYAYKHGWLIKLGFERDVSPYKDNCYTVYAIPFYDTNTVYVGLTDSIERRWSDHNNPNAKSISGALKYSLKTGIPMPDYPLIIEENLYAFEAQYFEDFWKKLYKSMGFNVLNKAKTGVGSGSLGSLPKVKNIEIIEAAKNCKTLKEFRTKHYNLFSAAVYRGILDKLLLTKRKKEKSGSYTEKHCYNLAKKYKTTKDFRAENSMVYLTAHRNGWLKQYWWLFSERDKTVIKTKGFKIKLYKSLASCLSKTDLTYADFYFCIKSKTPYNGSYYHYLDINDIEFDIPDFEHRYII